MKKEYNMKKTNIFVMKKEYKRIFAIIVATFLIISCSISVFASNNEFNDLYSMTFNVPCRFYASGTIVSSHYDNYCWEVWNTTPDVDVYCTWGYNWIGPSGVRKNGWILLSSVNFSARMNTYDDNNNKTTSDWSLTTTQTRTSDNNIFYRCIFNVYQNITLNSTNPSGIPITDFTNCRNEQDCFDYLYELLTTPPIVTNNGDKFIYTLPPGNMIILELANTLGDEITLSTTMPVKSALIGSPWDNSQKQCGLNEIPSDITLPFSGEHDIPWTVVGPYDSFGSSYSAYYHHVNQTGPGLLVTNYWVLINPIYYGTNNTNEVLVYNNGDIYMSVDGVISAKVYSLRSGRVMSIDDPPHIDNETNGTTWSGEIDEQTGNITWTNDQTGDIENPTTGGSNIISTGEDSFKSFLTSIANKIVSVFQPAHDAIQTIVQAINDFGSVLYSLYSWLPSPVYSIITSAIIVAITIGVVKTFL